MRETGLGASNFGRNTRRTHRQSFRWEKFGIPNAPSGVLLATMKTDAAKIVQRCDKCQRFAGVLKLHAVLFNIASRPYGPLINGGWIL